MDASGAQMVVKWRSTGPQFVLTVAQWGSSGTQLLVPKWCSVGHNGGHYYYNYYRYCAARVEAPPARY